MEILAIILCTLVFLACFGSLLGMFIVGFLKRHNP